MWHCRDKPPGQGHWPTSRAEAGLPRLGLQERRQQDRGWSATAPVSRTLPFTEALLPQCELGRDHSVRSTSLSWPAGFLNYGLEGRVQKITVHWLTHANTVHRTRTNSLESTAGLETLWPSPAESLQQRGRTARAQRNSTAQGCPRRRLSSSASQATRRQQGSRVQRT